DILVTGAGAVGSHAVEFLARRPEVKRIAVIDVRKATAEGLAWRARIGALQEDKDVVVTGFAVDLLDRAALEETLAAIRPRVVFHAATLLTVPEMHRGLKPEVFERVRRDGMGGFLAAHICLAAAVQAGLAAAGSAAPLIVASFPDFTIPVLARMGRTPITGIGNVDNMASELQSIAAERLGVWAR
ncbi:NAD-dependent epimerase/dehydratase family protein, partial [Mesorhizobium sp. M7D.F.Ca.US.004.03.1.1]